MEPTQAPQPPAQQQPAHHPAKKHATHTILALWLLIGPTVLWILTFTISAVSNYAFGAAEPSNDSLFANPTPAQVAVNILTFLMGIVAFLTWLPGLIIGIILLATRK